MVVLGGQDARPGLTLDAVAGTVHASTFSEVIMGVRTRSLFFVLAATIAVLGLVACSSGGDASKGTQAAGAGTAASLAPLPDVTDPSSGATTARKPAPTGPAIQVTWEALAREKYLLENSRFRRKGQPQPPQKIMLFSESHPEAQNVKRARTREERARYAGSAVVADRDMQRFLQGLKQQGFYRYAKRSGFDQALAGSDNARGRIIVAQGDDSYTLISMRGQGQNRETKAIPKLYSETKQAVMVLRNMTPTLNVSQYGYSGSAR